MIKIKNVATGYISSRGRVVVQPEISAMLREGEFTCLLGPNGAGKTTLLRTLAGFIPALSGNIVIDGQDITSCSPSELAKKIGVVLTERPSVSSMTVAQLVALGRSPYTGFWGRISDRDRHIIEISLREVGASALADRLVDTLSDGERQKVMVAKVLAQETQVIFLDEPTAFLDFPSKAEMMRLLKKFANRDGKIIFQSTHDINMALALADRLWLVDKQLGVTIGTPRELAGNGALERYFLRPGLQFDREAMLFTVS